MRRFKSGMKTKYAFGKKRNKMNEQWVRYRHGLYSCLLWWIIGAGIGILFATSLASEMKQSLAQHLESSISYLINENSPPFTYFLKRCLTYTQLLLLICVMEYFTFGYIGVRCLMLGRGFIYGFSQTAWIVGYGIKGIFLGLAAYCPHNLLFVAVVAWIEWLMRKNLILDRPGVRKVAVVVLFMIPSIAWLEAYGTSALFRACM